MALERYLAMTAAEFSAAERLPARVAWMGCHFSPYGPGLSNLPETLPAGSVILVDDWNPMSGHDAGVIARQLKDLCTRLSPRGILLDLQRPPCPETQALTDSLTAELPCPVAVTEPYAAGRSCPVFLSPPPPHRPLGEVLAPWEGRQLWLDGALMSQCATVTEAGCSVRDTEPLPPEAYPHLDSRLHCRYGIRTEPDRITFFLRRDRPLLETLLEEADRLGVCLSLGLYQELGERNR